MKLHQILAYPLQKRPDEQDPFRGGVEMPIGAQPFAATPYGNGGLAILTLGDPKGVGVWHPLIVAPAGVAFDTAIGRSVGPFIGHGLLGGDAVFIFRELPWPSTVLEATETRGAA